MSEILTIKTQPKIEGYYSLKRQKNLIGYKFRQQQPSLFNNVVQSD
jgi:hypothetical protein